MMLDYSSHIIMTLEISTRRSAGTYENKLLWISTHTMSLQDIIQCGVYILDEIETVPAGTFLVITQNDFKGHITYALFTIWKKVNTIFYRNIL